ncbi:MAG: Fpg/Nei family DNA glycosylase [Bacteroidales bacterium]
MPELPDIVVYQEALELRVAGTRLQRVRIASPFLLRTVTPPTAAIEGRVIQHVERVGKRLVFATEGDLFLVLHLMIAGRLHWKRAGASPPKRVGLAAFDFPAGTLTLTEAGTRKRASLHLVSSREALGALDPGGIDVLAAAAGQFAEVLRSRSHTLKRALTDPHLFSGIGNAYSDEILHAARLSPLQLTRNLSDEEVRRLYDAAGLVLRLWIERLRDEAGGEFPEKVTAFREEMSVHGRFGKPCPRCGAPVQRIVYAENEANYCARCQTAGRLLADRALSRLLHEDWPRKLEE